MPLTEHDVVRHITRDLLISESIGQDLDEVIDRAIQQFLQAEDAARCEERADWLQHKGMPFLVRGGE